MEKDEYKRLYKFIKSLEKGIKKEYLISNTVIPVGNIVFVKNKKTNVKSRLYIKDYRICKYDVIVDFCSIYHNKIKNYDFVYKINVLSLKLSDIIMENINAVVDPITGIITYK